MKNEKVVGGYGIPQGRYDTLKTVKKKKKIRKWKAKEQPNPEKEKSETPWVNSIHERKKKWNTIEQPNRGNEKILPSQF